MALEFLRGLSSGGVGNILSRFANSTMFYYLWLLIRCLFWFGALAIVLLVVKHLLAFKYKVRIYSKRGDALVTTDGRAKMSKNKAGAMCFDLFQGFMKKPISLPIPDYKYFILNDKGKSIIHYYKKGELDYAPIEITEDVKKKTVNLVPTDLDARNFLANQTQEDTAKYVNPIWYKSPQFMAMMTFIATIVICMIIIVYIVKVVPSAAGAAASNAVQAASKYIRPAG